MRDSTVPSMTVEQRLDRYIAIAEKVQRLEILTNDEMLELLDLREYLGVAQA
jgi:hypothetical protein